MFSSCGHAWWFAWFHYLQCHVIYAQILSVFSYISIADHIQTAQRHNRSEFNIVGTSCEHVWLKVNIISEIPLGYLKCPPLLCICHGTACRSWHNCATCSLLRISLIPVCNTHIKQKWRHQICPGPSHHRLAIYSIHPPWRATVTFSRWWSSRLITQSYSITFHPLCVDKSVESSVI